MAYLLLMWGQKRWIERFLTAINSISWLANKILDYRTFLLSEQKIKKHVRQECDLEYCLLRGDKLEKAVLEKLSVYDRRVTGKGSRFWATKWWWQGDVMSLNIKK